MRTGDREALDSAVRLGPGFWKGVRIAGLGSIMWIGAGCGAGDGQKEVLLTRELRIEAPSHAFDPERWGAALGAEVTAQEQVIRFEWVLEEGNWEAMKHETFRYPLPLPVRFRGDRHIRWELSGTSTYRDAKGSQRPDPGDFLASDHWLFVCPESLPLGELRCVAYVPRGILEDDGWHIANGRVTGRAVPVLPGETWTQELRIPDGMALRFFATAGGALSDAGDSGEARVAFRVDLDGERLFEEERSTLGTADRWHTVALPASAAGTTSTLELSVGGAPSPTAFVLPRIAPLTPPTPNRPDLLLFLADTFRADNMEAYGGATGQTPYLDALARESVLFQRAWSTSCWTLPAQASMLTGVLPPEHGALQREFMIPDELVTLAEVLASAGYRCGAITDAGFVSSTYNFDQGFEWFVEHPGWPTWDLEGTLRKARAFLDASDGRPSFLFVQTYRTHAPYRCGSDEDPGPLREFQEQSTRDLSRAEAQAELHSGPTVVGSRRFYLEGVADLDHKFRAFWEALRKCPGERYLVFTSDHGEAFFDHGNHGHRGTMYEELLRIPLFVHGPSLAPRQEPHAASLIDLPRTLAVLAGVAAPPAWRGTDLLALEAERPQFAFHRDGGRYEIVAIEGPHKLIGRDTWETSTLEHAFDLEDDPHERDNVLGRANWPAELRARWAVHVETLLRDHAPGVPLAEGALDETLRKQLADIGYAGD